MSRKKSQLAERVDCENCPLRKCDHFREFSHEEVEFVSHFKSGELTCDPGAAILVEGSHSPHLYTLIHGWAFRYKTLEDGRRQILNYVMPGDLIGLQGSLMGEMQHSIEALTPIRLCVFERERLHELYKSHPGLAFDLTWIAAREERILDEHLLSVGRRSALERAAYLLRYLSWRAETTIGPGDNTGIIPLTQTHIADTLGLSLVHTNKTLRKLADLKMVRWTDKGCKVLDADKLEILSGWSPEAEAQRPFI